MVSKFCRGLLISVAALCVGCGDGGPEVVPVTGVVTQDGKPVAAASLTFYPDSGRPSYGQTDSEGKYELTYDEDRPGAVVGQHTVKIMTGSSAPPPPAGQSSGGRERGGFTPPTELTLEEKQTVESGGSTIDIELPTS